MIFSGSSCTYQVIHEVIPHEGDKQVKMVDLMNKAVVKLSDNIVLRNKKYVADLVERYNVDSKRVHYLELWRRFPAFTKPRFSKRVLFFGRINPYKGADNLLEIARLCPEIQFDVVGRVDPQMQEIVKQLKMLPNVVVKSGYVSDEDMKDAFVNADWAIVPYNSASQSGVIIDAYKYSRPVIAFDVGAISEQVEDGKSGYLVKAGDNQKFAERLKKEFAMNKSQYIAMGLYAYGYGSKKYAAAGAVERFVKMLKKG